MFYKNINKWLEQARARDLSDMEIQKKLKAQGLDNKEINKVLVEAYHKNNITSNKKKQVKQKNKVINKTGDIYRLSKALKITNILILLALLSAIILGLLLPDDCSVNCLLYLLPSVIFFIIADLLFIISLIKFRHNIKKILQTLKGWLLILPCSIHLIYIIISFLSKP